MQHTAFSGAPNTHTCPVCTGMPGSLPVLNKQVAEYAAAVGLATNCTITQYCKFDRKNYFYPDNPAELSDFSALSSNLPQWTGRDQCRRKKEECKNP